MFFFVTIVTAAYVVFEWAIWEQMKMNETVGIPRKLPRILCLSTYLSIIRVTYFKRYRRNHYHSGFYLSIYLSSVTAYFLRIYCNKKVEILYLNSSTRVCSRLRPRGSIIHYGFSCYSFMYQLSCKVSSKSVLPKFLPINFAVFLTKAISLWSERLFIDQRFPNGGSVF